MELHYAVVFLAICSGVSCNPGKASKCRSLGLKLRLV